MHLKATYHTNAYQLYYLQENPLRVLLAPKLYFYENPYIKSPNMVQLPPNIPPNRVSPLQQNSDENISPFNNTDSRYFCGPSLGYFILDPHYGVTTQSL